MMTERARTARSLLAVGLLMAGLVTWAALPMAGAHVGAKPALIAAIGTAALGLIRLAVTSFRAGRSTSGEAVARTAGATFLSEPQVLWRQVITALVTAPWPQLLIVAVLGLEALHPRRPWHTAVLGLLLLGYLVALYLAESGARLAVFGPQAPVIAAGIGLARLSV